MGFIGEIDLCTFLSLSREKYQKSATQGRGLPYETHRQAHDTFTHKGAKVSECAEGRGYPIARTNGGAPSARNSPETRRGTGKPVARLRE